MAEVVRMLKLRNCVAKIILLLFCFTTSEGAAANIISSPAQLRPKLHPVGVPSLRGGMPMREDLTHQVLSMRSFSILSFVCRSSTRLSVVRVRQGMASWL